MAGATTLDDEPLALAPALMSCALDLAARPKFRAPPKFRVPKAHVEDVRRVGLLRRLDQARERALVLVSAPAGYGKTTLLTQWVADSGRRCAWLTLDPADGDPSALAESVAQALAVAGIEPGLSPAFLLVLDDAHVVRPGVLAEGVLGILGWLPEGSQLGVASRCQPALPLARMRAQRTMLELDSTNLAMSAGEAASLLEHAGLDPNVTSIETLVRQAEGWPAALQLAAISIAQRPVAAETAPVRGDEHPIAEYLRAELLAPLSPAAAGFLMRSSVLDRLSGTLCDEVLGRRRSARVLAKLARANVPITAIDRSHEWYRVHPLFRDMLQTELRRSEPELASTLHGQAADWYRRAGDVERALHHALGAGDLELTGELLWTNLPEYLGEGRNHAIHSCLSGVSAERAGGGALLALATAHVSLALGSVAVAEQWARAASARLADKPAEVTGPERAGVLIIDAWAARAGAKAMGELATAASELLSHDSPWLASCCFLRGTAALLTGDAAEADRRLLEGAARGAVLASDVASLCLAQLAVLATERDQTAIATDCAQRAWSIVADLSLGATPASALVYAVWGAAAMREGRVDEAKAAVARCLSLCGAIDDDLAWFGAETRILLARVSLALGDVAGARELLAVASRLARRTPDVVVFGRWFDDAWDQFDRRAERALAGMATLTTAELRVLRFLPTHYSFHEIAQRLHVSSNTVKTHVHAVYRKLDASSRSEAVAHAADAGLLGP